MKSQKAAALLCICCLCVNWITLPAKALEIPTGYNASFYSAFRNVIKGILGEKEVTHDEDGTYSFQWGDLNTDGTPELIVVGGDAYHRDGYVEVYQYDAQDAKAKSVYRKDLFLTHESGVSLGTLDGNKTIFYFSDDSYDGEYVQTYLYLSFDKSMHASTTELKVHSVGEYNFVDSYGHSGWDMESLDETALENFHQEFEKNGIEYTKNGEKITEAAYHAELNALEERSTGESDIFTCCGIEGVESKELLFEFDKAARLEEAKETAAAVGNDARSEVNLAEKMSDAERKELLEFIRIFDNWDYDGRQPKADTMLAKIFAVLEMMSYEYSEKYGKIQTAIQIPVLNRLAQDVFGLQLPYQKIKPSLESIHVDLSTNQAFSLREEGCVDYGYVFDELLGLYQVAPDLYYGIFRVADHGLEDDLLREDKIGYAVLQKESAGISYIWKCWYVNQNGKAVDADTLKSYREIALPESNIVFDYTKYQSVCTFHPYMDALEAALQAVDDQPNARGLAEITTFISHSLQQCALEHINIQQSHLEINGKHLRSVRSRLLKNAAEADKILKKHKIQLNQDYKKTARLDVDTQLEENAIQITFDRSAVEALKDIDELVIYMGDTQHACSLEVSSLEKLIGHTLQIKQIEGTTYAISYIDDAGKRVPYLDCPAMITLPASNARSSVMLTRADESENWGGQYDAKNNTIAFLAPYTGEYTVQDAQINITDIDMLSEEHRKAIAFMVSRGYFAANDGLFDPNASLSRYDFAKTLVGMFFAYRDDLTTTFPDVPKDSMYYQYVASGENRKIIHGYEDQKFHGQNEVLIDEVIAFCSRTLTDHKKYIEPNNPEDYLHFADLEQIPEWVKSDIALAVREGLIEDGGILLPEFPISRADAALMLYRLFMRLYEVQPISVQPSAPSDHSDDAAVGIGVIVCVGLVAAAGAGVVFQRRRKKD